MDEWYIQNEPSNRKFPGALGTSLNPVIDQINKDGQAITSLDDHWDLDPAADDNEAYSLELESLQ